MEFNSEIIVSFLHGDSMNFDAPLRFYSNNLFYDSFLEMAKEELDDPLKLVILLSYKDSCNLYNAFMMQEECERVVTIGFQETCCICSLLSNIDIDTGIEFTFSIEDNYSLTKYVKTSKKTYEVLDSEYYSINGKTLKEFQERKENLHFIEIGLNKTEIQEFLKEVHHCDVVTIGLYDETFSVKYNGFASKTHCHIVTFIPIDF